MAPQTEIDLEAEEWFNAFIPKLRYKQDFSICHGHSKSIIDEHGSQKGISIRRPYIRLFSTGVTKIYEMAVLGKEYPDVEYSKAEEKELDEFIESQEKVHAADGWD